jgi:hypothetical protein
VSVTTARRNLAKELERAQRKADTTEVNHFGEHVWLKFVPPNSEFTNREHLGDCCFIDEPCERHAKRPRPKCQRKGCVHDSEQAAQAHSDYLAKMTKHQKFLIEEFFDRNPDFRSEVKWFPSIEWLESMGALLTDEKFDEHVKAGKVIPYSPAAAEAGDG